MRRIPLVVRWLLGLPLLAGLITGGVFLAIGHFQPFYRTTVQPKVVEHFATRPEGPIRDVDCRPHIRIDPADGNADFRCSFTDRAGRPREVAVHSQLMHVRGHRGDFTELSFPGEETAEAGTSPAASIPTEPDYAALALALEELKHSGAAKHGLRSVTLGKGILAIEYAERRGGPSTRVQWDPATGRLRPDTPAFSDAETATFPLARLSASRITARARALVRKEHGTRLPSLSIVQEGIGLALIFGVDGRRGHATYNGPIEGKLDRQ